MSSLFLVDTSEPLIVPLHDVAKIFLASNDRAAFLASVVFHGILPIGTTRNRLTESRLLDTE
jgi:hypothetical protein